VFIYDITQDISLLSNVLVFFSKNKEEVARDFEVELEGIDHDYSERCMEES